MPERREDEARAFYADILGFDEETKPEILQGRGGVWFRAGPLRLHLGVEMPFVPARKAHPGIEVENLDAAKAHLDSMGHSWSQDVDISDIRRIYVADPFGNRIEILETR
ncbi:VOC family protein [Actibacterium sp. 188UL27-1]|uniref:VOC family protein n=1 Tax=Actibacterium sp. 188UL27-1 TaxID=2786961 RepID=UPI001EF54E34